MIAKWIERWQEGHWLLANGDIVLVERVNGKHLWYLAGKHDKSLSWWHEHGQQNYTFKSDKDLVAPAFVWITHDGKPFPFPVPGDVRVEVRYQDGKCRKLAARMIEWARVECFQVIGREERRESAAVYAAEPAEVKWQPAYIPPGAFVVTPGALSNEDLRELVGGYCDPIVADNTPIPPMKFLDRIEQGLRLEKVVAEANAEIERLCGLNTEQAVEIDRLRKVTMDRIRGYDARIALLNAEIARLMDKISGAANALGVKR